MKTLEEIKENLNLLIKEIYRLSTEMKHGFHVSDCLEEVVERADYEIDELNKSIDEHAAHVWQEAITAQKLINAEHANILISNSNWERNLKQLGYIDCEGSHYEVNKDSILNSPDAVNPFKK